jgi:hypothetical protein
MDKVIPNHRMYGSIIQPHRPKNDVSIEKNPCSIVIDSTLLCGIFIKSSTILYNYSDSISFLIRAIFTIHIANSGYIWEFFLKSLSYKYL